VHDHKRENHDTTEGHVQFSTIEGHLPVDIPSSLQSNCNVKQNREVQVDLEHVCGDRNASSRELAEVLPLVEVSVCIHIIRAQEKVEVTAGVHQHEQQQKDGTQRETLTIVFEFEFEVLIAEDGEYEEENTGLEHVEPMTIKKLNPTPPEKPHKLRES
tara:strand:+ start:2182 stop:2655 length:474 start_codon:yes stop_codon:yes gene_type:complete